MSLAIEQLRKSFTAPDGSTLSVVDIESLRIAAGQQVALVGSSGSGKTTLLHLIAGILVPDSGRILFYLDDAPARTPDQADASPGKGRCVDIAQLPEAQRDIFRGRYMGYIFQVHHLLAGFTALENVLLGMSFTGRRHDAAWARHLLDRVGLSDRMDYKPDKLSVGQQQRVAVARALANRPKLVLADEPTGSLDRANARQVLALIRELCAEVGAMLLLVSHDPQITGQFGRVLTLSELNRCTSHAPIGQS